jgi:hypothetical protein
MRSGIKGTRETQGSRTTSVALCISILVIPGREANPESRIPGPMLRIAPE